MKNLVFWAVLLSASGYVGSKLLLHHKVESGVDNAFLMVSPFVNIEYDGVSSTMTGELTIDGIRATVVGFNDPIIIERLGIDTPSYFSLLRLADIAENKASPDEIMPDYFGIIAEGVRLKVNADYMRKIHSARVAALDVDDADEPANRCSGKYGYSPDDLAALGYSEQVASASVHFRRGKGNYSVTLVSNVDDMWDMDLNVTLDGDMVTEMSKGSRYRPKLRDLRVELHDDSLNKRVQKYCTTLGLDSEQILAAQLDALQYFGGENGIMFDEYVIEPYKEFLSGKEHFVITAKPSEPVSLSQISLYKPSDVPALLDLSATAH